MKHFSIALLALLTLVFSQSASASRIAPRHNVDLGDMVAESVLATFFPEVDGQGYTYAAKLENSVWSDFRQDSIYGYGNDKYGKSVQFRFRAVPALGYDFVEWRQYDWGVYRTISTEAEFEYTLEAGDDEFKLVAIFARQASAVDTTLVDSDPNFVAWYYMDGTTKHYLGAENPLNITLPTDMQVAAEHGTMTATGDYLVQVDGLTRGYDDIQSALDFAAGWRDAVVMVNADVTISGTVTVPANVTLLVPGESEECYYDTPAAVNMSDIMDYGFRALLGSIAPYHTMTLANGAVLNIEGRMSVSSKVMAAEGGTFLTSGSPIERYGNVVLSQGAKINVQDGGRLYAWGFITGEGEVEAMSGARVHESFQFADMASKNQLSALLNAVSYGIFPFSQYGIQNIESQVTFHYGSANIVTSYMSLIGYVVNTGNITFVTSANDENAGMFILNDASASLVRHYDGQQNKQCYTVHGNATLGSVRLMLGVGGMSAIVSSADYTLPLTNNMDIALAAGSKLSTDVYVCMFPGCRLSVEQGATLDIEKYGLLSIYDFDDSESWIFDGFNYMPLTYVPSRNVVYTNGSDSYVLGDQLLNLAVSGMGLDPDQFASRMSFIIWSLPNAEVDFAGTIEAHGPFTVTESGANVHSSNGTGVLVVDMEDFFADDDAYDTFVDRTGFDMDMDGNMSLYSYRFVHMEASSIEDIIVEIPSKFVRINVGDDTYYEGVQQAIMARMLSGEPVQFQASETSGSWQIQQYSPTAIEEVTPSQQATKYLRDGRLYIRRGARTYDLLGR